MSTASIRILLTMLLFGALILSSVHAEIPEMISTQGKVVDPSGLPVPDNTYWMRFRIYDASSGGNLEWDSGAVLATVEDGVYNVQLGQSPQPSISLPFDEDYWLLTTFEGDDQLPRQQVCSSGYSYIASGLVPGTEIMGSIYGGHVLSVANSDSGDALVAVAAFPPDGGSAIVGINYYGTDPAIRGESRGTFSGSIGVYGFSDFHTGVYGETYSYAGYGTKYGVYGECGRAGDGTGIGVGGEGTHYGGSFSGPYRGVIGSATDTAAGIGVFGTGYIAGVQGEAQTTDGIGVVGLQPGNTIGDTGTWWKPGGFFAGSNGAFGYTNTSGGYGVLAEASNPATRAIYAITDALNHNYGLQTPDNIYSMNYNLSGAIMHVVENDDVGILERGDIVVFTGVTREVSEYDPPIPHVAKTQKAQNTAVAGVVYGGFDQHSPSAQLNTSDSSAPSRDDLDSQMVLPGERLLIVVQGPALVKASASSGLITPGSLLTSSGIEGFSEKAPEIIHEGIRTAPLGCIVGKALETLDSGEQTIRAFVTLQ